MATELTKLEWIEILQNQEISKPINIDIFQTIYNFPEFKAPAGQVGKILGYKGKNTAGPLNSEIGNYAKRIAKYYDINFTARNSKKYKFWDLFFNGFDETDFFYWQLRNELRLALEETGLTGEVVFPEEIELDEQVLLKEGIKKTIVVNTYERNPKARKTCIEHWKAICSVCNLDFQEKYGEIGKGFIHVHHLTPISEIGKKYQIDPINDLRPVCPNCHSMLHRKNHRFQ